MKIICVPRDLLALDRLNYDVSESGDLIEIYIDNHTLIKLFEVDFFQKINDKSNSNIDNFEDENIVEIEKISEVLNSNIFEGTSYSDDLQEIVYKIKQLFQQALNRGTGVFFYF